MWWLEYNIRADYYHSWLAHLWVWRESLLEMTEDKLPRAFVFVTTWELVVIADSMYDGPEEIIFHYCVCSVSWCTGHRFNTGEGSENFIRRFRVCLSRVVKLWVFSTEHLLSSLCSRMFCSLPHLLSDRFLKIAGDLRKPSGSGAENWEELGVDVPPALFLDLLLFSMLTCCRGWWQQLHNPYYFTNIFWRIFLSKKAITIGLSIDVVI